MFESTYTMLKAHPGEAEAVLPMSIQFDRTSRRLKTRRWSYNLGGEAVASGLSLAVLALIMFLG